MRPGAKKLLTIIFTVFLLVFAGGFHLYMHTHPRFILVGLDTSYSMKNRWHKVEEEAKRIGKGFYARFCLITDKKMVHSFQRDLEMKNIVPYGPRALQQITDENRHPEIRKSDVLYIITAKDANTANLPKKWNIILVH